MRNVTQNARQVLKDLRELQAANIYDAQRDTFESDIEAIRTALTESIKTLDMVELAYRKHFSKSLYPGDQVAVKIQPPEQTVFNCYDRRIFIVHIQNTSHITWRGRTLNFVKEKSLQPEVTTNPQPIQVLNPGDTARIPVVIDMRGGEGTFLLKCEIHDENGDNCFPDKPDLIQIPVTVQIKP